MSYAAKRRKIRLTALCVLATSAVLLTGAGRFGDDLQSRRRIREQNRAALHQAVQTVLDGAFRESGEKNPLNLRELSSREPELVLSLLCSDLKPLSHR